MRRILIVEDESSIALALDDDLRREGYETEVATDGDTAARTAISQAFDLILLDVMLPGKDGFEVCREVRRAGVQTPIVMLTAKTREAEKVLGLELGADDYVTKPYSARELRARVKAHLRRGVAHTSDVYRFGDAELDFTRCELRRGGKVVELSALEFELLTAFVRRSGCLLTREQLLDEVWGHRTHVTNRVVDNQVTNLRRTIEPEPERPRVRLGGRSGVRSLGAGELPAEAHRVEVATQPGDGCAPGCQARTRPTREAGAASVGRVGPPIGHETPFIALRPCWTAAPRRR